MKHKLNICLFVVPVFVLFVMNLVFPHTETVSLLEKRVIHGLPSFTVERLFSGQYLREYDNYFADNFVYRDSLVQAGSTIKSFKGISGDNGATLIVQKGNNMSEKMTNSKPGDQGKAEANAGDVQPPSKLETTGTPSASPEASAVPAATPTSSVKPAEDSKTTADSGEKEGVQQTASDTYLVLKDRGMSLYQYSAESAEAYANAVNSIQEAIDPKIKVYSLLVPSQIEFVEDEKYRKLSASQKDAFQHVYEKYNPHITPIDAYSALQDHKDEYIYFRTDHHWTGLGAYYGYSAFMKASGEEPISLSQYKTEELKGYLGSTYSATLSKALKKNPDTITIYKPFTPYEYHVSWHDNIPFKRNVVDLKYADDGIGGYAVFLEGDSQWGTITTNVKNGKRIMVIKDSYANDFIPFLLPHYEAIYFVDPRSFNLNLVDYFKDKNITDVLFLNSSIVTTYTGIADLLNEKMKLVKK